MKVFAFDPVTGKRGAWIGEMPRPHALTNHNMTRCTLPRAGRDTTWRVATRVYHNGVPDTKFHGRPVCFCLGQFTAGETTTWDWYALIPEDK